MKPKILLAAIAKNEAAYLPEWIFHHLNVGVEGIIIYVNNTDDNTIAVLELLKKKYPVEYKIVDGISEKEDKYFQEVINKRWLANSPLHSKSYADIYRNTDPDKYDYILYIDIDEYLCFKNELTGDTFGAFDQDSVMLFRWFSLTGDNEMFTCLSENLNGEFDDLTKYMVKTGLDNIMFSNTHKVLHNNKQPRVYEDALLLHRTLRSREEYIALLARSNPSKNRLSNGFKINRRGWTNRAGSILPSQFSDRLKEYKQKYEEFLDSAGLHIELDIARKNVSYRSAQVVENINLIKKQNSELVKVFKGTGITHFSFYEWFLSELKHSFINFFFPSLKIKHTTLNEKLKSLFKVKK